MTNVINYSMDHYIDDNYAVNEQTLSNTAFGIRLQRLRKNAGVSRAQMAEQLGMETNSLGLIEHGINGMSKKNIIMLNIIYGFDLNYLLTGKYLSNENIRTDALRDKWISIYDSCPSEKTEALIFISEQISDNFR